MKTLSLRSALSLYLSEQSVNQSLSTMMLFWDNPGDSKPITAYYWLISTYKFSRLICIHFLVWENVIKDQSIFCLVIINSHNHIFWHCVDIVRRKLILVITQGHPMSIFRKLRKKKLSQFSNCSAASHVGPFKDRGTKY